MLYTDNELNAVEKAGVEEFIAANPDLKAELEMFRQVKLDTNETLIFPDKASLLKQEAAQTGITTSNYEAYFVLYNDNELSNEDKAAVESFVYRNPALQREFELLQQSRVSADKNIVFENKQSLYRHKEDDKVIPFRWWRIAAAAATILFVSGLVWMNTRKDNGALRLAANDKATPVKQSTSPVAGKTPEDKENGIQSTTTVIASAPQQPQGKHALKNATYAEAVIPVLPGKIKNNNSNIPDQRNVTPVDELAKITDKNMNGTTIDPIKQKTADADIKRPFIAAAKEPLIDQPAIILNPDENKTQVEYASLNNDNVEVLNTTVNTKNALRGFLRKASRLIAKKTSSDDEDGKRKGILIGGFEIAVR